MYSLAWTYSTHRYLKGFADAIIPLTGSTQQKTEALLAWLRHEPERKDEVVEGVANRRDPVIIVQNEKLLKICGSASNAFLNLAGAAGLNVRRLLLLDHSGGTMHVVAEVQWDGRWVVVDPAHGRIFEDGFGRPLSKQELRRPDVFLDAISRIPGYDPSYTFAHTAHIHLRRIPWLGTLLDRMLDRFSPGWQESVDWGYFAENPSLWPTLISLPLFLLAILLRYFAGAYSRSKMRVKAMQLQLTARA